jgi:hypothetical protein
VRAGRFVTFALVVALGATLPAVAQVAPPRPSPSAPLLCDPIDPARCLLPFPNDFFTVADATTDTGLRVDLTVAAMPRNAAGRPIDPTEWNRNDGWSPGSPLLTLVPGLDLHRTWGTGGLPERERDHIADLARYAAPDAPIVVIDTSTGERHPFWSELDTHPETTDAERLLILRPAVNFREGTRYVVALRGLRRGDGSTIEAGAAFAHLRDGTAPALPDPNLEARRPAMERVFADLAAAGIARDDLYLAWDFTIASERNLSERALRIRDDAFALLGDHDLGDGIIEGAPPAFTVDEVTDFAPEDNRATMRRIEGTISVPNYLTPQHTVLLSSPVEVPDPVGESELPVALPLSRFNTVGSEDGLPARNPLQPDVEVPFVCNVARGSDVEASHPYLYGHGLLGGRGEANGGSTEDLRLRGFTPCAVDWWGMSTADLATVALILADVSNFPSLADRSQQGFLNFLFLGRALAHPEGLASDPAFRRDDGAPLIRTGELAYVGNSQGGIMGGALTALAPDFTRAVLGVPGMNYSTLLNRSVDWEGSYAVIAYTTYPGKIDQQLLFALMQMLWDRAEGNGYAHHMGADPLPDTPAHQVLLQVAFADHQVANVAAEVEARTIGAFLHDPALPDGLHWSVDPTFGLPPVAGDATPGASYLVYWWSADRGLTTPPNGNLPPGTGDDPHEDPRRDNAGSDQLRHFLLTGELLDVCGGPCVTTDASRAN